MKKLALLTFALVTIVACKNSTKEEKQTVTEEENTVIETTQKSTLETGCYEYNSNGNLITMEITEVNENVMADLNIAYAEKDSNKGKFVGKLNGDNLIGTYTFMSEGKESSRELAFMIKDNQLIEGYGDLNEDGTKFMDVKTIQYTSTMPLTKVDCTK
ncbi:hypothetical protein J3S90_09500 [Flavobacterium sp. P4023]|uniref:Uncharacterized protein n=1 Tax=Flavobacterium flabelliforme TaxID=2816119 RepID=A0ABS5CTU1_9FLAO|nr:hypothetical protein [Flavobacterium flabelliforme]MBP4142037.1 hypothetical protein [Flavobacterium flabelliforme]